MGSGAVSAHVLLQCVRDHVETRDRIVDIELEGVDNVVELVDADAETHGSPEVDLARGDLLVPLPIDAVDLVAKTFAREVERANNNVPRSHRDSRVIVHRDQAAKGLRVSADRGQLDSDDAREKIRNGARPPALEDDGSKIDMEVRKDGDQFDCGKRGERAVQP